MLTVGLDVGTQGCKAILYEVESKAIKGRGAVSYGLISERQGQAEQDPAACKDVMAQALADCDRSQIKALAVSGQQHGLVVLDSDNKVIRPAKLWCDLESAKEAQELSEAFHTTIVPSFTITKLLWLKRNEPENYARIAHFMLPHDYINFWLTGNFTMEASDASGTGIFDPVTRVWDEERINTVDSNITQWVPDQILGPDTSAGSLIDHAAQELGLSGNNHVLVGPGGGDNAMSALGIGAVVEQGIWVLSVGTSGTLFGPTKAPILDTSGTICAFCDATGHALPLLCTINCTGVTEEVKNLCSGGLDHAELAELAAKEPPGCHGVTFLPYLGGERTPNWPGATGTLLGLKPGLMRPGVLYRAAMEGATFSLLNGFEEMKRQAAAESEILNATELRIVGGGSKNHTWRQLIADVFQLPLRFPVEPETAALGAALQAAAVASGVLVAEFLKSPQGQPQLESEVLQPNADNKNAYAEAFERFTRLGVALFGPKGVVVPS